MQGSTWVGGGRFRGNEPCPALITDRLLLFQKGSVGPHSPLPVQSAGHPQAPESVGLHCSYGGSLRQCGGPEHGPERHHLTDHVWQQLCLLSLSGRGTGGSTQA